MDAYQAAVAVGWQGIVVAATVESAEESLVVVAVVVAEFGTIAGTRQKYKH